MKIQGFENFDFNLVEMIVNNSCPLDCTYCFLENRGEADNMSVETMQNVIRMCKQAQEIHPQKYISVMPALKEPMLSWSRFKQALETLEFDPYDYKIFFTFNTNGVLITDEIFNYCQRNLIDLHVSLDGPKDIHDRGRIYRGNKSGSSWEKVMELINKHPNCDYFSLMTTLHYQDIDRVEEIFNFMSNLPIKCWVYALNKFDPWDDESLAKLEAGIKRFIDNATPAQLMKTRFQNTAAAFPNINVVNGLKVEQDGTVVLQPPTPNDGAQEGEFCHRVFLGNVNEEVVIPEKYQKRRYSDYEIVGPHCTKDCNLYSFCKSGTHKIYVNEFSCNRVKHFDRMARYAKGGTMTDEEYKKIRDSYPIFNAVINLTDGCNLRCPYCFTEHNARQIDLGTMKAAINFILRECDRVPKNGVTPGIAFFGGEPMLRFDDIIKPTIEWSEESGIRQKYGLTFSMTTNGTLLTEERLQFLSAHDCPILLSIDGDKPTQDDQRPTANGASSFDMVYKNIPNILKYFPNTTFRSAVEPRNADKIFENYLFARKMGFMHYFITPNLFATWEEKDIKTAMGQLALIAETMYKDISENTPPLIWDEFEAILKNCFVPHEDNRISFNHCGIGTNSCGIACNGDINGCQEHNTYVKHDIFYIGNIFTGIDEARHKRLLDAFRGNGHPTCKERPEYCNTCEFYDECAHHYCPSHNLGSCNECTENQIVNCVWKKFTKELALMILKQAEESKNYKFLEYLECIFSTKESRNYAAW